MLKTALRYFCKNAQNAIDENDYICYDSDNVYCGLRKKPTAARRRRTWKTSIDSGIARCRLTSE